MSSVPMRVGNNISVDINQPSARRYYGPSSRRHHDSSSDVNNVERPLLQSTPCRRLYDTCQSEAHWNGRDGAGPVVHRVKSTSTAAPPATDSNDKDKQRQSSFYCCGGSMRVRSQAQMVDVVSRVLFPCVFLIFNIVYWPYYLFFCAP